ncbi:MAG: LytR/AlgR family response regulator transcription factor [Mucilaginibacter sp.]
MQQDISILIIEDDALWAEGLTDNLADFGFSVAGSADSFESAIVALNKLSYDIVLLDISLNGRYEGIELGKMLSELYHKPFIFITANFDKQILDLAINARPSAYLTKPVNSASLYVSIQTAISNFNANKTAVPAEAQAIKSEAFFVKLGDKYKKIDWKDVVYLVSSRNYTLLFNAADQKEYYIRSSVNRTLRYIVPQQLQGRFIQVNRSEVVQQSFIQELISDEILTPYKRFTVGETFLRNVRRQLNIIA